MIRQLNFDEWMALDPVFEDEFQTCIPDPKHTGIIGEFDGDTLRGFVTVESVPVVGMLYTYPEYRNKLRIPYHLLDAVEDAVRPTRRSLYAMTENPSVEKFLQRRGAREIPLKIYRKDY
jgi:GNAT superfamily N-acetyltransferase